MPVQFIQYVVELFESYFPIINDKYILKFYNIFLIYDMDTNINL